MAAVFTSIDSISIDGIPAGNIVDVISNHGPRRAEVLAAYNVFTAKLNSDHAALLQSVQADLATKTTDLATVTQAKTTLESQVATLSIEKQSLTSQVAMLEAVIESQKQKIVELAQYQPYNPRILKGEAFYDRVSQEDRDTLVASDNPQLQLVGRTIIAYRKNKWPVILDSEDFALLVGYVLQSGVFDEDEVTSIMRDATKEEAYTIDPQTWGLRIVEDALG